MTEFIILDCDTNITLANGWQIAETHRENCTYDGREYSVVAKHNRSQTLAERVGKVFLGLLAVLFTLGIALASSTIRNLFTEKNLTKTFLAPKGIDIVVRTLNPSGSLKHIHVDVNSLGLDLDRVYLTEEDERVTLREMAEEVIKEINRVSTEGNLQVGQDYAFFLTPNDKNPIASSLARYQYCSSKKPLIEYLKGRPRTPVSNTKNAIEAGKGDICLYSIFAALADKGHIADVDVGFWETVKVVEGIPEAKVDYFLSIKLLSL